MVVTLSKYSICSSNALFCAFSCVETDTSEFLAIISSLTRFIRTSSFSISTRTVRLTTGFPPPCFLSGVFPLCAAAAGALWVTAALAAAFSAGVPAALSTAVPPVISSTSVSPTTRLYTFSISETRSMTFVTTSIVESETTIRLNSVSNRSSSISCADGRDTIISPISSIDLKTRNARAAFNIQLSCTFTSKLYAFFPIFWASLNTCFCSSVKAISEAASFFGAVSLDCEAA